MTDNVAATVRGGTEGGRKKSPTIGSPSMKATHRRVPSPMRPPPKVSPDGAASGVSWCPLVPVPMGSVTAASPLMRRTSSLGALCSNKPDWGRYTMLILDKKTQTPSEWQDDCPADVTVAWCCGDAAGGGLDTNGLLMTLHHPHGSWGHHRRRHSNPSSPVHFQHKPANNVSSTSRCSSVGSAVTSPVLLSGSSSVSRRTPARRTPPERPTSAADRRTPVSSPSSPPPLWQPSCFPPSGHTPTALPAQAEHMDRFIRQRLQQQSRSSEHSGLATGSARQSPVPADHSLAPHLSAAAAGGVRQRGPQHMAGRSGGVLAPLMPRPLLPRFRGSVEGLDQEIEGLVLKAGPWDLSPAPDDWLTDGRRAPLPDCFLRTRSVNTQTTPHSPHSAPASPHSLPSPHRGCSPSFCRFSPCPSTPPAGTPPADEGGSRSPLANTSPHINKFLAREPPTGSQRVALRTTDESACSSESWQYLKPSVPFTLRASLGSAFCPPQHRAAPAGNADGAVAAEATDSTAALARHPTDTSKSGAGAATGSTLQSTLPLRIDAMEQSTIPNLLPSTQGGQ